MRMKRLYLVRHAKSSWRDRELSDEARPLNKRGKRDAIRMGEYLARVRKVAPDLVMASPARRARDTVILLTGALGYSQDRIVWQRGIYTGDASDLLTLVRQVDDGCREAMLVGHNPYLTDLANLLSGETVKRVPTCGVFCLDFDVETWQALVEGSGKTAFFDRPKHVLSG